MYFNFFSDVRNSYGQLCTADLFRRMMDSDSVKDCAARLQDPNLTADERQQIKSQMLPVITWQASYTDNKRCNSNAVSSGMYMLDIDHCDDRVDAIISKAVEMREKLDIVYVGRSISGKGVRIVAECRPEFDSIEECQRWLADKLEVEYDAACKDWARASYMVPSSYVSYMDEKLFERAPKCVYSTRTEYRSAACVALSPKQEESRGELCFNDLPFSDIIAQYWQLTDGEPEEGRRNTSLYKLACALRYICDFDESRMKRVIPTLGLPEREVASLIHNACTAPRGGEIPRKLREAIEMLQQLKRFDEESDRAEDMPEVERFADVFTTDEVPDLPPVFKEWYDIAPDDFKLAVVLTMLPFLGTLGSKLRARYFNGEVHSPSFICCVEAPQANGKSFVRRLDEGIMSNIKEHDRKERDKERAWKEARRAERDARVKYSKKELAELMKQKPEPLIRYVAATASVTELLKKIVNARGLHVMAVSEEIDTVHKAMKRGFSDFSDILRKAFDNAEHGQDYASEQSWSGIVRLYFNTVYCGTPKAVKRFFPDVEDGMISRVIFVTFPDQSFKPVPTWGSFSKSQQERIAHHLERLSSISLQDEEVQEDHMMEMEFMVREMKRWCSAQQKLARSSNDITRDTFCRRSAVIGFRAAMLAYFLWEERHASSAVRAKVKRFGVWVANCCLRQFLLRFDLREETTSTIRFVDIFNILPTEFDKEMLTAAIRAHGRTTRTREVLYRWRLAGLIEENDDKSLFRKIDNGNCK